MMDVAPPILQTTPKKRGRPKKIIGELNQVGGSLIPKRRLNNIERLGSTSGAPSTYFSGYVEVGRKPALEFKNDPIWSKNERIKLLSLMEGYTSLASDNMSNDATNKEIDWDEIANDDEINHTANECFIYYTNTLSNSINREPWTTDEELMIISLANEYEETNWAKIAELVGTNRTAWQCFSHYQQALNTSFLNTKEWTDEENKKLAYAVETYGTKNWQQVANELTGRNAIQCNNRWKKTLESDSMIVGGHWCDEEEKRLLLTAYAHEIPPSINFTFENRKLQENKKLIQQWANIASFIPSKDYNRIREKWINQSDPSLLFAKFTPEEDALLLRLVQEHGSSNWSKLTNFFPGNISTHFLTYLLNLTYSVILTYFYLLIRSHRLKNTAKMAHADQQSRPVTTKSKRIY